MGGGEKGKAGDGVEGLVCEEDGRVSGVGVGLLELTCMQCAYRNNLSMGGSLGFRPWYEAGCSSSVSVFNWVRIPLLCVHRMTKQAHWGMQPQGISHQCPEGSTVPPPPLIFVARRIRTSLGNLAPGWDRRQLQYPSLVTSEHQGPACLLWRGIVGCAHGVKGGRDTLAWTWEGAPPRVCRRSVEVEPACGAPSATEVRSPAGERTPRQHWPLWKCADLKLAIFNRCKRACLGLFLQCGQGVSWI